MTLIKFIMFIGNHSLPPILWNCMFEVPCGVTVDALVGACCMAIC